MNRPNHLRFAALAALALCLGGCAAMKTVGLASKTDSEMRSGAGGSAARPEVLNPFNAYRLVMADNECRFFQLRVPSHWCWKLFVTASNEDPGQEATLSASFDTSGGSWNPLVPLESYRDFTVTDASSQGALGVANGGADRVMTLRLCQKGAPVRVVLESRVSAYGEALLEPPLNKQLPERPGTP